MQLDFREFRRSTPFVIEQLIKALYICIDSWYAWHGYPFQFLSDHPVNKDIATEHRPIADGLTIGLGDCYFVFPVLNLNFVTFAKMGTIILTNKLASNVFYVIKSILLE